MDRNPPWTYRLTDEALIEEIGEKVRVYGRWDWEFGCWDLDFDGGTYEPVEINWPILAPSGVWLEPETIRGPAGALASPEWRQAARAAFAAWFSIIPLPARRLAAPLGKDQWRGLTLIRRDPAAARQLDVPCPADRPVPAAGWEQTPRDPRRKLKR